MESQNTFQLLKDISIAVAQAETTEEAFAEALRLTCQFMEWPLGHVYRWSPTTGAYTSARIWYVRDEAGYQAFREFSERSQFKPGESTVGRVAESLSTLRLLDVRSDEAFGRELPADDGICAYFAFPVLVENRVEAVLEFCANNPDEPEEIINAIIQHTSALLGLAIQREIVLKRLRENELLLAESQRVARLAHWEWNVVQDDVTWSPELYRILGVDPDSIELTYSSTMERAHPDDVAFVQEKIADAVQRTDPFDYFYRIVRTDGTVRQVHERVQVDRDESGNIIRYYGTTQDVTEQKEGELRLAETVHQLSVLMEIGQTVAGTFDLETIYEKVLSLVGPLLNADILILLLHREDETLEVAAELVGGGVEQMIGVRIPVDSGISGDVWRTEQSVLVTGEACRQRVSREYHRHTGFTPEAIIAAPVRGYSKIIGVLVASHRDETGFNASHLQLLETAANWTAIAIENAEQYRTLQRRLREKDAIAAISIAMTEAIDVRELLRVVVGQVQIAVPRADWTIIHLLQPDTNRLELAASAGLELELEPDAYGIERLEGVAGYVLSKGRAVRIADMQKDPRRLPIDSAINTRSLIVAPIESRMQLLGTISAQCATPDAFTREDERLLQILGVQAGIAIENSQLHEAQREARERAERQSERIRQMAYRVVEAQEKERSRIARELHDEAGQVLTSLTISLGLLSAQLPAELTDVRDQLDSLKKHANSAMGSLRQMAHNLRPPGLDQLGIHASLEGMAEEYQSHTRLKIDYSGIELPDLSSLSALTLYRFTQEALTNAARHAGASHVQVTLGANDESVIVTVEDDGRGFEPPDFKNVVPREGSGLVGMLERLEIVDGHLVIRSHPGAGARLTAVIPYVRGSA